MSKVNAKQTDLKDDSEYTKTSDRSKIKKDPKSFTQNLFDTAAMKLLQFVRLPEAYLQWAHPYGDDHKALSNSSENRDRIGATKNTAPVDQHVGGVEDPVQACYSSPKEPRVPIHMISAHDKSDSTPTLTNDILNEDLRSDPRHSTTGSKNAGDLDRTAPQSHNETSIDPAQHPQTLSHFNLSNMMGLCHTLNACLPSSKEEIYLREEMGRTDTRPFHVHASCPHNAEQHEDLLAYSVQSITYVLGNVEPLLQSFLSADHNTNTSRTVSAYDFHSMSGAFRILSRFDVHPYSILPSLWVSAGKLYLPGIAHFIAPNKGRGRSGTQRYLNHASSTPRMELQDYLGSLETCHIAKIILAALVASVPPCDTDMWPAICKLRASGKIVPASFVTESSNDHNMVSELLTTVHAFEDEMALSLLTRLLKSLAGRHYVTGILRNRSLEQGENNNNHNYPLTFQRLVRYVTSKSPTVFIAESEARPTLKDGRLDDSGELEIAANMRVPLLSLVEWLRTVILKEWDGKPKVLKCSAIGAALELLSEMCKPHILPVPLIIMKLTLQLLQNISASNLTSFIPLSWLRGSM